MALSMFLRTPACASRLINQQIRHLALQPALSRKIACNMLPASSFCLKEPRNLPCVSSVRDFKTTAVSRVHGDEHPHDHAKMWVFEKSVTAVLFCTMPLALVVPNKILDVVVAVLMTAHSHWGLEAIAVDYVRESIFGKIIPKIAIALVYLIHIATLGGLFYIIGHDVGLANLVRHFWSIKTTQNA